MCCGLTCGVPFEVAQHDDGALIERESAERAHDELLCFNVSIADGLGREGIDVGIAEFAMVRATTPVRRHAKRDAAQPRPYRSARVVIEAAAMNDKEDVLREIVEVFWRHAKANEHAAHVAQLGLKDRAKRGRARDKVLHTRRLAGRPWILRRAFGIRSPDAEFINIFIHLPERQACKRQRAQGSSQTRELPTVPATGAVSHSTALSSASSR